MKTNLFPALVIIVLLMTAIIPLAAQTSAAGTMEIIIHYQRENKDYTTWNIWSWPFGSEGQVYLFEETDDFGGVARFNIAEADRIGFIVRTNEWEKDVTEDRFIDPALGNEIWVFSGESEFSYTPPEGYGAIIHFENLTLTVHRHRYDGAYEGETVEVSAGNRTFAGTRTGTDSFGAVFRVNLTDVNSRDQTTVRFGNGDTLNVMLGRANEAAAMNIYSVQGRTRLGYEAGDLSLDKRVAEAVMDGTDIINVRLSYPVPVAGGSSFGAVLDAGGRTAGTGTAINESADPVYGKLADGYATSFAMRPAAGEFSIADIYRVSFQGYEAAPVAIGNKIFGSDRFAELFTYMGELGALYSKEQTVFRLWAPTASQVLLNLYPDGDNSQIADTLALRRIENGAWELAIGGDLKNTYYTYTVTVGGTTNSEVVDPYAKAAGVNGKRGMVVDLQSTNPANWNPNYKPPFGSPVDAIIYEIHVRDLSVHRNSGIASKGKYLAFTERGTVNPDGLSTGLDHILELGVTHVHLLPVFDFRTVDESRLNMAQFNWGYDPENYNLPEGSYSTDPYDGNVRINEFKQMVQAMHDSGLRVVMDVVYNHTSLSATSNLNLIVPGYYYRMTEDGNFSNGSGCGNETASERSMVRKFIIDSVVYWATEYNIDGFRFDLMALHDIDTMNAVRAALDKIDPSIIVYGEGWTGGATPLPENMQALKMNASLLNERIAMFSDDIRDGIKGHVFTDDNPGFVSGNFREWRENVKFGITGSVYHPQINYSALRAGYANAPWAAAPTQTISYASKHDNLTLWDKFKASRSDLNETQWLKLNKMSALLIFTSQGIPFFQAGEEMARTKFGNSNSYDAPDSINQIDWSHKTFYNDLFQYYTGLIALRKSEPAFRLQTAAEVADAINFLDTVPEVIAYTLKTGNGTILVAVNSSNDEVKLDLPQRGWDILVNGDSAGTEVLGTINGKTLNIPPRTGFVLRSNQKPGNLTWALIAGAVVVLAGGAYAAIRIAVKKRK